MLFYRVAVSFNFFLPSLTRKDLQELFLNVQAYQIEILWKHIEGNTGNMQCKSVSQAEVLRKKLRVLRELNVTVLSRKRNKAECYQTYT